LVETAHSSGGDFCRRRRGLWQKGPESDFLQIQAVDKFYPGDFSRPGKYKETNTLPTRSPCQSPQRRDSTVIASSVSVMSHIHDVIEQRGKQGTLQYGFAREEVEAAAAYMADEDAGIGFLYSGWCQAALPHRRLPEDQAWQIDGERVTLIVEPGSIPGAGGKPRRIGVPYGSRARLIMLYLQSEALRTNSREVELGRSMKHWLSKMGISGGGKSIHQVRDQAARIVHCRLSFTMTGTRIREHQNIVDRAIFLDDPDDDGRQGKLFAETARLSESFFEQLKKHPVPLEEAAIRAINNNSMALDVYAWLAYRLHVLSGPRPISWAALKGQFGAGFARVDNFRTTFSDNLRLALAVYRSARVEADDCGLTLYPSRPPVAPRLSLVKSPAPTARYR
jgi:Plasmid encoded RepA protein